MVAFVFFIFSCSIYFVYFFLEYGSWKNSLYFSDRNANFNVGIFLLIIVFKWNNWCRTILMILYIGGNIYLGINHHISKWYIIVPLSIFLLFYMIWNIGGVKNCIIANKYKMQLDTAVSESKGSYAGYKDGVERYNTRNGLGFWTKVKIKKEPNWKKYEFRASGLDMFILEHALLGITTNHWKTQIVKISKINSNLVDKNNALKNNESLYKEKYTINRIKEKSESFGRKTGDFDKNREKLDLKIEEGRKTEKKILKKRW